MTKNIYKAFVGGRDQKLSIGELVEYYETGVLKPDSRIYNKETAQWVDFKDYAKLHKLLSVYDPTLAKEDKPPLSRKKHELPPKHPKLLDCPYCGHACSSRAEKCPNCLHSLTIKECAVCKQQIPITSSSCPKCGDPEPFGQHPKYNVVSEIGSSPSEPKVTSSQVNSREQIATKEKENFTEAQGVRRPLWLRILIMVPFVILWSIARGIIVEFSDPGIIRAAILMGISVAFCLVWFKTRFPPS